MTYITTDENAPPSIAPFRDPDLTNERALDAMDRVADRIVVAALAARRDLLDIGFSDAHQMCRDLDAIARQWAINREVVRRDRRYRTALDVTAALVHLYGGEVSL